MAQRRPARMFAATAAAILVATTALAACGSSGSSADASGPVSGSGSASTAGPVSTAPSTTGSASPSAAGSAAGSAAAAPSSAAATESATGGAGASCQPADMKTVKAGTLTIATDQPVYEPWFVDNKPENGEGFEGAVAYAVAAKLGYAKSAVTWVRVGFDAAISPAPKNFDFDIDEFSITPDRLKVVAMSSGYYDVTQAVVTTAGSKIAGATTVAALKGARLGAQLGTTSLTAINDVIKPTQRPAVFNTNDDAVKALQNGQIDGVVTDLPTAFYMSGAQLSNGKVIGQLPPIPGADVEQFGLLMDQQSTIATCVSDAVNALRADGTLKSLATKWLAKAGAPELK